MTREKRYLVASIALAIVALIVLGAGIAAQGSIDWSQSSVTPNHTPVRAGERVTFTIQVVNSSTVTATDVFVYNPIPKGTDFVTVGNGFPIVGGEAETVNAQAMDTPDVSVSSGEAYDASTDSTVPLDSVDPGDVTAVGWVGDVGPGAANATAMDLALDAVSVSPVDPVITDTAYVYHAGTMTSVSGTVETVGATTVIYMPIMVHNADMSPTTTQGFTTTPYARWVIGAEADTFEEAQQGEDEVFDPGYRESPTETADISSYRPIGGGVQIVRSYILFDLSEAPQGRIADAAFVIEPTVCSQKPLFYAASWTDKPGWWDWSDFLGEADPADITDPSIYKCGKVITVPLPGLVDQPVSADLRMLMREDESVDSLYNGGFTFVLNMGELHLSIADEEQ
jgi:uncharacterized repeat protein (TIGR01451 family)